MLRILSSRSLIFVAAVSLAPFALQAQATTCKDGTTSAATGKGACSGHGGVDKSAAKARKSEAKVAKAEAKPDVKTETKAAKSEVKATRKAAKTTAAAPAPAPAAAPAPAHVRAPVTTAKTTAANTDPTDATAKCKDGTYSHAKTHRGACSRHGGVAEWLKT